MVIVLSYNHKWKSTVSRTNPSIIPVAENSARSFLRAVQPSFCGCLVDCRTASLSSLSIYSHSVHYHGSARQHCSCIGRWFNLWASIIWYTVRSLGICTTCWRICWRNAVSSWLKARALSGSRLPGPSSIAPYRSLRIHPYRVFLVYRVLLLHATLRSCAPASAHAPYTPSYYLHFVIIVLVALFVSLKSNIFLAHLISTKKKHRQNRIQDIISP